MQLLSRDFEYKQRKISLRRQIMNDRCSDTIVKDTTLKHQNNNDKDEKTYWNFIKQSGPIHCSIHTILKSESHGSITKYQTKT